MYFCMIYYRLFLSMASWCALGFPVVPNPTGPGADSRSRDQRGDISAHMGTRTPPSRPFLLEYSSLTHQSHRLDFFLAYTSQRTRNLGVAHACLVCSRETVYCQINRTDSFRWQIHYSESRIRRSRIVWTQALQAQHLLQVHQRL